jgi:hypothetical protein
MRERAGRRIAYNTFITGTPHPSPGSLYERTP